MNQWSILPLLRAARRHYPDKTSNRYYTSVTHPLAAPFTRVSPALSNLKFLLSTRKSSPDAVWTAYINALSGSEPSAIDLRTHQIVLRQCTLTPTEMRKSSKRIRLSIVRPVPGHVHESRFQTVIRNIWSLGRKPERHDYHFVLVQFAAVGHTVGSMEVYQEMKDDGRLMPDSVTFALVLQSIAHRLVVPERVADRQETVNHARNLLRQLLNDMQKAQVPWSSINMNLTIRIMKHTSDTQSFEDLLRLGYGIDLRYPDRPALDANSSVKNLMPVTIDTLNTVVDMFGLSGNISKLVQAFEVLTVPLPQAQKHFFTSFEDEDDFGTSPDPSTSFKFPSIHPNTTTFAFLLRHVSQAGKTQLARHYMLHAIRYDIYVSRGFRKRLVVTPNIADVKSPRMAVNRAMFLSVLSTGNRNKNVPLLRWIWEQIHSVVRRKKADVLHVSNFIKHLGRIGQWPPPRSPRSPRPPKRSSEDPEYLEVDGVRWRLADIDSVLNLDIDTQQPIPAPTTKPINLSLHLRILKKDIDELNAFHHYSRTILARTIERQKDRLGRRVWRNQDIYLKDTGKRQRVSKEQWRQIVNYKPKLHSGFARLPSHFRHKLIREQYMREARRDLEEKYDGRVKSQERLRQMNLQTHSRQSTPENGSESPLS
ncbi:hypothetical protein BDP27DRAFT_1313258 [Rhodocollybia butyracea]|uniref:Uncharacterized protein n=1 Tax=Rhodocollybia butyracea TaxID=206335 RepID=A0A9P5Q833_9AGAR|nr:hypothetical protein BDP27DRAFT_1313258 [Rhodocollybia butyracea]